MKRSSQLISQVISEQDLIHFIKDLDFSKSLIQEDPVYYVHQFKSSKDQEIVAFLSALLAFGNVKAIHQDIQKVLQALGPNPFQSIQKQIWKKTIHHFKLGHRWIKHKDITHLFLVIQTLLKKYDRLENFFLSHYQNTDKDVGEMLNRAKREWNIYSKNFIQSRGFSYFFSAPEDGSPCKRLMMFLRWMCRAADGIDLGLWKFIPTHSLVIPLDTHLYQFAMRFNLTKKKTASWQMAKELTQWLKKINNQDPVRYDFQICHYGMKFGW